jgi:hypothetical protein
MQLNLLFKEVYLLLAGYYAPNSISKLDSPNTTSAITYKMQGNAGDGTVCVFNVAGYLGTLTAFEIEG